MGLGLAVDIAALGANAARSVVERRKQIGVLRPLGFQKSTMQFAFLLESSDGRRRGCPPWCFRHGRHSVLGFRPADHHRRSDRGTMTV